MVNARQKLIELLFDVPDVSVGNGAAGIIADYLIANGVTVQQWISVDHPPENWKGEGGYMTNFYVYTPEYGVDIGNYMKPANKWLCMGIPCNVTHWMTLPEPPGEG